MTDTQHSPTYKNIDFNVTIPITITGEDIEDILVTAFEGGIGYWCPQAEPREDTKLKQEPHEPTSIFLTRALLVEGMIRLHEVCEGEDKWHYLTPRDLVRGVEKWFRLRAGQHRTPSLDGGRLDTGDIDVVEADVIVQYALFNEVVYG